MALCCYGGWLYKTGGSLYDLRHTLLEAQRRVLGLKPFASIVWEIISRWELAEPTEHRTPLPEPLLRAMVAVAWLTGYKQFAGVAMLAYFGLGRIGEVLQTRRSDLLLPQEDLWEQGRSAFLRLGSSKTANRGRVRIQHLKIVDSMAITLLSRAFGSLDKDEFLFPKSPAAFRYRWDKILASLSIDRGLRRTPERATRRRAVKAYRDGVPIPEIQWLMRMKHQHTLEFYIQEVRAVTALSDLSEAAVQKVKSAALLYPFLHCENSQASLPPQSPCLRRFGTGALRAEFLSAGPGNRWIGNLAKDVAALWLSGRR